MTDTEKLLAEIEETLVPLEGWAGTGFAGQALTWLPKLVEIVREQQKEIECKYTLKQAARLEVGELKRQLEEANERMAYIQTTWHEQNEHQHATIDRYREKLAEMRGDMRELLKGEPCTDDDDVSMPEDTWLCLTHQHIGNTKQPCLIRRLRKKWGVK